ncbi:type III secretion system translocon subunit SctE [Citrobacter sp. wls826]|uniref:type III secretion system translocon subunit SctE n=1 Tax=Citrobacter sp. wls826 TaxID=2576415 RepID=UPI0010C993F3|nr:type III secretion system translocon subunit SctE [Citrobacter sp. wls826]TKU24784.1 hypothetical protein FDW87_01880 [Citrobacter sp. wls826]TKV30109.1 hypothetical protein FDX20_27185 [Citrobacter sp. TBCS-11]
MNDIQNFILQQQKVAFNFNADRKALLIPNQSKVHYNISASYPSILNGAKNPFFFVPKLNSPNPSSATRYTNSANLVAVISRLTSLETKTNIDQLKLNCQKFIALKEAAQNSNQQLANEYSELLGTYHTFSKELSALAKKIAENMVSGTEVSDVDKANFISQLKVASDLLLKLSACRQKISIQNNNIQIMSDKLDNPSDMALAAALTVILIKLGSETAENELKNQLETFQCAQRSLQEVMAQKAKEFDERIHTSKLTQKLMKLVGTLVGVGLQILGIVGAAFSGGTSLALSIMGTIVLGALFLTEKTVEYVWDIDLVGYAMNEALKLMTQGFTEILQEFGLDGDPAQKIGKVMSAIIMVVAITAVTVMATWGGAKVISKFAKPVAKNAMKTILKMVKTIVNTSTSLGQIGLSTTEAIVGVANGYNISQADKALANFKSAQASVKALEKLLNNASSTFNTRQKEITQLNESLSSTIQQVSETCLQMSTKLRV